MVNENKYIYTMKYYLALNKVVKFADKIYGTGSNHPESNPKQNNKYCMFSLLCGH